MKLQALITFRAWRIQRKSRVIILEVVGAAIWSGAMTALVPLVLVAIAFCCYFFYRQRRDDWVQRKPFPAHWLPYLNAGLPIYEALSEAEQTRLRKLIQLFIARKRFYGCEGLVITDEVRVTVASQACLLLVNQNGAVYPELKSVLIYPAAFRVVRDQHNEDGTVAHAGHHLSGESWSNGKVILSWDDVEKGVRNFSDGHNVALHEFAHQLDSASGSTNGAPFLRDNSYQSWAIIFSENFEDLRTRTLQKKKSVMDSYGTTNPAEFFAVATETFFEKPNELYKRRPELYDELSQYYQLDPRQWHGSD
ncbi:MAG: Mlc titration factor MtfA (ptsG expression regulator) [Halioglobus sp.]